jgi:hypothetical protein
MSTAILPQTLELGLSQANPGFLADALRKVDLGSMLYQQVETITQSAATTVTLAKPAFGPAGVMVRVTGGVSLGAYLVVDSGGIAVNVGTEIGVCKLSDDGLTLTFASNVTACKVVYAAAAAALKDEAFGF